MFKLDELLALDYLVESREELAAAEKDILAIESEGESFSEERISRISRAIHSVKSGSLLFDLVKIGELAQKLENAIARIRFQGSPPTQARISMLLRAIDRLNELILSPHESNRADISGLTAQLAIPDASLPACIRKGGTAKESHEHGAAERLRILLVEDDVACRLLLQSFLARYGECHVALNGREAVEAFHAAFARGSGYDLICMDIMMPEMDGREAVRQIRASEEDRGIRSPYGATIFMTTTMQEIGEVFRCFRELCDAYLLKPIDLGQLLNKMKFFQMVQ